MLEICHAFILLFKSIISSLSQAVCNVTSIVIPIDIKMKTPVFDRKLLFHITRSFITPIMTHNIQETNNIKYFLKSHT